MKALLRAWLLFALFIACYSPVTLYGQIELKYLSTFSTGAFDESAAEIAAYDPISKRVFFTNALADILIVLDISNPAAPVAIDTIDMTVYGTTVTSVAIFNGIVATAVPVEADDTPQPGKVVFLDTNGNFLNSVTVGFLPDMITFSPDGKLVLTANEGEPNDDYTIDPEGSVSIVDISNGVASATATTIGFESYNDKKASLLNRGIRIFGPNATVAQDLEPEYITVTPDGTRAYVACQENNALAVINLSNKTLLDILPLGVKDHQRGRPQVKEYVLNELVPNWPALGTPVYDGGQPTVMLGGFSGLFYDATQSDENKAVFFSIPDRGPNPEPVSRNTVTPVAPQNLRPYKLPDYQGRIVKFTLDRSTGEVTLDEQVLLTQKDGQTPISGKGNVPGFDEVPVTFADPNTPYANVDFVGADGEEYHLLPYDPYAGDFEGILRDNDGNFWACDENRPAIYKFQPNGVLIERFVPAGTSQLGSTPQPAGFYGAETLPAVYSKRWSNRGFEAIAYNPETDVVYAFIQSPMDNPNSGAVRNRSDIIRILGVRASDGVPVEEYVYLLERNRDAGIGLSRVDKIGDAVYTGNGRFLVLERDSGIPTDGPKSKKFIFELNLTGATNIIGTPLAEKSTSSGAADKTLEMMTADDLAAAGIVPVHKTKVLNLPSIGYFPSEKAEGIALLPDGSIAVVNDNDFGLAGAGTTDATSLGIISFVDSSYAFDASDRDGGINFNNWPVYGYYLPDAIAAFAQNGANYIISANEGDTRDYDGYSEERRVSGLTLDPTAYPNAATLRNNANIGRLLSTTSSGDLDGDGDVDQIYSIGARSFTIWDTDGNLVYDSGDELERITAAAFPEYFNSSNSSNSSFDSRSDDKGPEPEAVTVATIEGVTYAFIGLERIGGVMVYDLTDPTKPEFIQYINNRNFAADARSAEAGDLGVEDIVFVSAENSPSGQPLLITANEVSGTISIFTIELPIVEQPCVVSAGALKTAGSSSSICQENGIAILSANQASYPQVPAGYQVAYVLTRGNNLVIQRVSDRAEFMVSGTGTYRIHTLVYDPATLDLGIVVPGSTTGGAVNALLIQGGGEICGALDVAGAEFSVQNCGNPCTVAAGSLQPLANTSICLPVIGTETVEVKFARQPRVPAGFRVAYVLTYGNNLVIQGVSNTPSFRFGRSTGRTGKYTIHTLVYHPATLNLGIINTGVTTGFQVNSLLVQGGGAICAALDVAGTSFNLISCASNAVVASNGDLMEENLTVYPNPASFENGEVVLHLETAQLGETRTRIFDQLGRIVRETEQWKEGAVLDQTLNLQGLNSGLYIIQVMVGEYRKELKLVVEK